MRKGINIMDIILYQKLYGNKRLAEVNVSWIYYCNNVLITSIHNYTSRCLVLVVVESPLMVWSMDSRVFEEWCAMLRPFLLSLPLLRMCVLRISRRIGRQATIAVDMPNTVRARLQDLSEKATVLLIVDSEPRAQATWPDEFRPRHTEGKGFDMWRWVDHVDLAPAERLELSGGSVERVL